MSLSSLYEPQRWLTGFAIAYLALLPTNSATFPRSIAFGGAVLFALIVYIRAWRDPATRIVFAGPSVLVPLLVWALWSTASMAWSLRPRYSMLQLEREVLDSLLAIFCFYVAARDAATLRAFIATALASFTFYAVIAIGMAIAHGTWDPSLHHHGVGPYSTWVVLVAPLLFALIAPPPIGFGNGLRSAAIGVPIIVLMVVTARMTDNRMVWIALAAVFGVASIGALFRWRQARLRARLRWALPLCALLLVLGLAFADALNERGQVHDPPQGDLTTTFEKDPRLLLWGSVKDKIGAQPLQGYGFGRQILAFDVTEDTQNTRLSHAHNMLLSQWLQTGIVGAGAFLALLIALAWRYVRFMRSRDDQLAFAGVIGIALIAGFTVKNMTDDFLFRSNAKEFWVLTAMLLGYGAQREAARDEKARRSEPVIAANA